MAVDIPQESQNKGVYESDLKNAFTLATFAPETMSVLFANGSNKLSFNTVAEFITYLNNNGIGGGGSGGVSGSKIYVGTSVPSSGVGVADDVYIRSNGDVYQKLTSTNWGTPVFNIAGSDGADGATGQGVPAGGTSGQILAKSNDNDYQTEWIDAPSGSGGTASDFYEVVVLNASDAVSGVLQVNLALSSQTRDYVIINYDTNAAEINLDLIGTIPTGKGQIIRVKTLIGSFTPGTIRIRRNTGTPVNYTNKHKVVEGWLQPEFYIEASNEDVKVTRLGQQEFVDADTYADAQDEVFSYTRTVRIAGLEYVYDSTQTPTSSAGDNPTSDPLHDATGKQLVFEFVDQAGAFGVFKARPYDLVATTNNQNIRSGVIWKAVAGQTLYPVGGGIIDIYREEQNWSSSPVTLNAGTGKTLTKDQSSADQTMTLDVNVSRVRLIWQASESNWWVEFPALNVPFSNQVPKVSSLAALKALDTGAYSQANHEGKLFSFKSGNFTANDYTIIKADSVSLGVGAWTTPPEAYFDASPYVTVNNSGDNSTVINSLLQLFKAVRLPYGTIRIDNPIIINQSRMSLVGVGGGTLIYNYGANKNTIQIAPDNLATDTALFGIEVGFFHAQYQASNPTSGAHIYAAMVSNSNFSHMRLINHNKQIQIRGAGESTFWHDIDLFSNGVNVSSLTADSAGISIERLERTSADTNANQDSTDSLYYTEPNSVYLNNINVRANGVSNVGMKYGLHVEACDGLYVSNSHFGFASTACFHLKQIQANLPLVSVYVTTSFIDPLASKTEYGIWAEANAAITVNSTRVSFKNIVVDEGASKNCVHVAANYVGYSFEGYFYGATEDLVELNGNYCSVSGEFLTPGASFAHVQINSAIGCDVSGKIRGGGAYGIELTGTAQSCQIHDLWINSSGSFTGKPIANKSSVRDNKVTNTVIAGKQNPTITSASTVTIEHPYDTIFLNSGTAIDTIDDTAANGNQQWNGRVITINANGAGNQINDGTGNINLASNWTPASNEFIQLYYKNGAWYEMWRS